jgi:hypothetical protein
VAARALSATLPGLEGLDRIDLVAEPACLIGESDWPGPAALEHWLRAHGFAGSLALHRLSAHAAAEAGERMQALAATVGAKWMAMGCYGHSHAREWLVGGASRSVLRGVQRCRRPRARRAAAVRRCVRSTGGRR